MAIGVHIDLVGFDRMLRALKDSDEIAYKEIEKSMKGIASSIKRAAVGLIPENPVSNWGSWAGTRDWDQASVRQSIRFQKKGMGKRSVGLAYEVTMGGKGGTPAGAIWALIGSGKRTTTTQGEHLVQVINERFPIERWKGSGKQGPRALVEAYYAAKPEGTDEEIARAIATALERAMN